MSFKCGIVGLPNVGNLLSLMLLLILKAQAAISHNRSNVSSTKADERLNNLESIKIKNN